MNLEHYTNVLRQIIEHPETWDQKLWHCGSTHCFAGWAELFLMQEQFLHFLPTSQLMKLANESGLAICQNSNAYLGVKYAPQLFSRRALTSYRALYDGDNTLQDLIDFHFVLAWCEAHGVGPSVFYHYYTDWPSGGVS